MALTLFAAACTTNAASGPPTYDSVRERLSESPTPTRLFIGGDVSTGELTARRWTTGGWVEGDSTLTIVSGEMSATADSSGKLALKTFEVGVAPLDIPEEVFKKPAQLTDVKVKLRAPTVGGVVWTNDNQATAKLSLALDLEWAIAVNGGKTPLGTQHLPMIEVDVALTGDGEVVDATLGLAASGELWNWAGLLELTRLELQLGAETTTAQ